MHGVKLSLKDQVAYNMTVNPHYGSWGQKQERKLVCIKISQSEAIA